MRPLKETGTPIADTISPKPFAVFQAALDGGQPFGRRYYWKSAEAAELTDDLGASLEACAGRIASPFSAILMMHMDGAAARIPADATAVGIRGARYGLVIQAAWENAAEDETHIGWARDSLAGVQPFVSGGAYVNFLTADEGEIRLRAAYGSTLYDRLRSVKAEYDPGNLFRGNLGIRPA